MPTPGVDHQPSHEGTMPAWAARTGWGGMADVGSCVFGVMCVLVAGSQALHAATALGWAPLAAAVGQHQPGQVWVGLRWDRKRFLHNCHMYGGFLHQYYSNINIIINIYFFNCCYYSVVFLQFNLNFSVFYCFNKSCANWNSTFSEQIFIEGQWSSCRSRIS